MKKVKLNLDALAVESFGTSVEEGDMGTVKANARTLDPALWTCNRFQGTCDGCNTVLTYCGDPCSGTAVQYYTCKATCQWP